MAEVEKPVEPKATDSKGWHSRRYMPHFDSTLVVQHVTFHLADSLPAAVVERMAKELQTVPADKRAVERRKRIDAWIDAGHGSCLLKRPDAAEGVEQALLFFDAVRYQLLAWVVMPNHVHVLFQPMESWTLGRIVSSWKSFTGRRLAALAPKAPEIGNRIWHREYWDRFIRDQKHFDAAKTYIHQNPVKAGLAARPEEWKWSSARLTPTL